MNMPVPVEPAGFAQIIDKYLNTPTVDLGKLEKMVELQERMARWNAETAFNHALSEVQAEIHRVRPDRRNDQTRSVYASYAAMDEATRPIYSKHGFALSFGTIDGAPLGCLRVVCDVSKGGYVKRYQLDIPADGVGAKGNAVMTKTHATGSAVTYARRYLLAMIFNIPVGFDDDGQSAGRVPRRPTTPAPNPMDLPPHDPETGEILDTPPASGAAAAGSFESHAPNDSAAASDSERIVELDKMMGEVATKGMAALEAAWNDLPKEHRAVLKSALERRYKPAATEADAQRK
jgi:ERF superfamily